MDGAQVDVRSSHNLLHTSIISHDFVSTFEPGIKGAEPLVLLSHEFSCCYYCGRFGRSAFCLVSRMQSLDVNLPTTTLLLFRAGPCSILNNSVFSYLMQRQVGSLEQEVASSELTQQHGR
jgi:hypothetical protein